VDALWISLLPLVATSAGGLFALKAAKHLHLILGFTAGVLLGVVGFDVLPEIFALVRDHAITATGPMITLVGGFLLFHAAEKLLLVHHGQEHSYAQHHHPSVGLLSALALTGHSFLDGVGIGLAFQVSEHVGLMVALAIIAHDFADGLNTVSLMLLHGNTPRRALTLLALDAAAPVAGAAVTLLVRFSPTVLALYLGFFGGFLLYLGAADILPEAHSERSSVLTIGLTCAGAAFVFLVTQLVG
jgi:zinc transporter, ZIP family